MILDKIDYAILDLLQKNAKLNVKAIGLKVGLTSSPTHERIKKLEKNGIITNYSININSKKIGLNLEVFCQVKLQVHSKRLITHFENSIKKMPEVVGCNHIAGNFDYLLKIVTKDIPSYQLFLKNKLSVIESVANVQSNFVMSNVKKEEIIPVKFA